MVLVIVILRSDSQQVPYSIYDYNILGQNKYINIFFGHEAKSALLIDHFLNYRSQMLHAKIS